MCHSPISKSNTCLLAIQRELPVLGLLLMSPHEEGMGVVLILTMDKLMSRMNHTSLNLLGSMRKVKMTEHKGATSL